VIEIRERFDVPAEPDRVWEVLADPYAVVGCVPGASIAGQEDDGSLDASVMVKFGPTRVSFKVRAMLELDEPAHQGHITAQGRDGIGGTRMKSTATFGVQPGPGRLASLIEGGASLVVKRMSAEFAERLAARCSEGAAR
jgi:carbon monoxide dehydrogenase subunit G